MTRRIKTKKTNARHTEFRDALAGLIRAHSKNLPKDEMLAVAAQVVGQIIAHQDQRKMGPEEAMKIVSYNIRIGNQSALDALKSIPIKGTIQ